jgi:mannose-6-phosphate isomerase-like protein (cupin superfamily)
MLDSMTPYTHISRVEADDWMAAYPDFGEMRSYAGGLDSEQVALTWRRMAPGTGGRGSYGHSHRTQEEVVLVTRGTITFKIGDDVFEAGEGDAIRIAPEAVRSLHNDTDTDAELVLCSVRASSGEDEVIKHDDFWPD